MLPVELPPTAEFRFRGKPTPELPRANVFPCSSPHPHSFVTSWAILGSGLVSLSVRLPSPWFLLPSFAYVIRIYTGKIVPLVDY